MNIKQLSQFLVKAKINTYALGDKKKEKILQDGSKELIFTERDFEYRDRYFGFNPFIGEEVVFQNKKAIWGMNYYGKVISEIVSAKQVYKFLRKALKQVKEDRPFRGPNSFKEKDFEYINQSKETIEDFKGSERIFYKGQEIYRLHYSGGWLGL